MSPAQTLAATLPYLKPEVCLALGIGTVLLGEIGLPKKERSVLGWTATAFALLALAMAVKAPPAAPGISPMIFADGAASFLKALAAASAAVICLLVLRSREAEVLPAGETHAFVLSAALGCCLLASARNLLMLYLAMEIVSYTSYLLAGFLRKDLRSNEAALKYVLYGAVASGTMLFGIATLYGMAGTLDLARIGPALLKGQAGPALLVPFTMILVGLGFKVSAAPFHQWAPDVYEGAPTPVAAFLSVAPKMAGMVALARVCWLGLSGMPAGGFGRGPGGMVAALNWPVVLGVLSGFTMITGNLCALFQTNAKRLLAYSSIAHAGYMLMALSAASSTGEGLGAVLFYGAVYLAMNLGAFGVVMAMSRITGSEELRAWRGLGWRHPFLGCCMVVFLMSLTGVPPFAGFVGKFLLFKAALLAADQPLSLAGGAEAPFGWMYLLIGIGLLNSVVSLYYYVSVAKALFVEKRPEGLPEPSGSAGWLQPLTIGILAAATVWLGIRWGALAGAAEAAVRGFGAAP